MTARSTEPNALRSAAEVAEHGSGDSEHPQAPRPPSARPRPRMEARSAWSTWQAEGDTAASADFLVRVAPWLEGTAAQVLRQKWPAGAPRPTASDVQERLCRQLDVVAGGPSVAHVEALARARTAVVEDLRRAFGFSGLR